MYFLNSVDITTDFFNSFEKAFSFFTDFVPDLIKPIWAIFLGVLWFVLLIKLAKFILLLG